MPTDRIYGIQYEKSEPAIKNIEIRHGIKGCSRPKMMSGIPHLKRKGIGAENR